MLTSIHNIYQKYLSSYRGLPNNCWTSIIFTLIQSIVIGVCYFVSIYFTNTLNINIETTGVLLSCYGAGTITGGYLSGKFSDSLSHHLISRISLLMEAFSFILLAYFTSTFPLMITLFILGLSVYSFKTSNDIFLLEQCRDDSGLRLRAVNISRAAMNLGLGLSGVIVGTLGQFGFNKLFYLFSFTLIITLLFHFRLNKANQHTNTKPTALTQQNNNAYNFRIIALTLSSLFCVGLMIAQLSTTYPIYVIESFPTLGMKAVSILYLLDTFLIVFTQVPLTHFLNRFDKIILLGLGAFTMGLGMLILSFSAYFWLAILSCIIWTTGEMIFMPTAQVVCYENGGENKKGHSLGLFQATYALSAVLGPTLGGLVYHYMSGNTVWYLCATLGILCLTACLYFAKTSLIPLSKHADAAA